MREKFISFFKKNKIYILMYSLGFLILLLLLNQVVMYADDFSLDLQNDGTLMGILKQELTHYLSWGGGLTPLYVSLVLKLGFWSWKFILSIIITTMFYLMSKVIAKTQKQFIIIFSVIWALFYLINISIFRETVLWLDGSMAYVIATFSLFMFIYMLYTRFMLGKYKKYDVVLLPIIALFSGWSSAQTSAVSIVLTILLFIWYIFISHQKINKNFVLFIVFSVIGSALFFFSPGNGLRMEAFEVFNGLNIIDKILYTVGNVSDIIFNIKNNGFMATPYYVLILSVLILFLSILQIKKCENKKIKVLLVTSSVVQMLFILFMLAIKFIDKPGLTESILNFENLYNLKNANMLGISNFIPYIIIFCNLLFELISIIYYSIKEKDYLLLVLFLAIYGCFYSMVFAPYMPVRTCLTSIIFIIFAAIIIINYLLKNDFDITDIVPVITIWFNIPLSILIYALINVFKKNNLQKMPIVLTFAILISFSVLNYMLTFIKYYNNKIVYNQNVTILENYNGTDKIIYLNKLPDDNYAFSTFIGADWIESDVKGYFNIPKEVKLEYFEEEK